MHEQRCTSRYPALMDRLLLGDLPPRKMRKLSGHLAGCAACQQRYNRVVLACRLLEGGPRALTVPSEGELRRVGDEVLRRARLVPDTAPSRRGLWRWIAAGATAAVALAIAAPLALHHSRPASRAVGGRSGPTQEFSTELQPRGGSGAAAPSVGLRAFCIRKVDGLPQVTGLAPALPGEAGPLTACRLDDVLKFAYTNRSDLGFLFILGVDDKYRIKWYEPHPPQRASVAARRDAVDEPLPRAVRLAVNHQGGQLRLFALFSAQPLSASAVERAVERARAAKTPLTKLASLPVDGAAEQRSILVRLVP
jgi:hypothetical protein